MNNNLKFLGLFIIVLVIFSCKEKTEIQNTEKDVIKKEQLVEADLKKVALNIEGMTCEIGCARTIQSKLSKTDGVDFVKVNFEEKKGIVEYDANKISEKEIVAVVEKIAGGDLYKVSDIKTTE